MPKKKTTPKTTALTNEVECFTFPDGRVLVVEFRAPTPKEKGWWISASADLEWLVYDIHTNDDFLGWDYHARAANYVDNNSSRITARRWL